MMLICQYSCKQCFVLVRNQLMQVWSICWVQTSAYSTSDKCDKTLSAAVAYPHQALIAYVILLRITEVKTNCRMLSSAVNVHIQTKMTH